MRNDEPKPEWQSDNYQDARDKFLGACENRACSVTSYLHPERGPKGEELATDVAYFGDRDAQHLLVLVSGVHGVEGFSGSATQIGWIHEKGYDDLPPGTAVLLIHMINPYGAAYIRRYTEGNVDLCRNFLDFSQALPKNAAYDDYRHDLAPNGALAKNVDHVGEFLGARVKSNGFEAVIEALMGGQYDDAAGFGFGGTEPVWSNTTLRNVLRSHGQNATKVAMIEFHTGLGPWGYGSVICMHDGHDLERARQWFGPWVVAPNAGEGIGDQETHRVKGHTIDAYMSSYPNAQVTAATLEFGTYPPQQTLICLLQEHLLVNGEAPDQAKLQKIKAELLEFHHPKNWDWRCAFWSRSKQMVRQAMRGLSQ